MYCALFLTLMKYLSPAGSINFSVLSSCEIFNVPSFMLSKLMPLNDAGVSSKNLHGFILNFCDASSSCRNVSVAKPKLSSTCCIVAPVSFPSQCCITTHW